MTRTLQDQLIEKGLHQKKNQPKEKKQKKEQLSKRDIEDLMGVRRPKYHRVKGSYRSR